MKAANWLLIFTCAASLQLRPQEVRAQENGEGNTATTIRALQQEWAKALAHNDNQSLDLMFDNAMVIVEYGRLVSKGEYLSKIRQTPSQLDQSTPEPITVHTFGSTVIVIGTYRETKIRGGRASIQRWRFIDTWVHKKGGWMVVAAAAAPASEQ